MLKWFALTNLNDKFYSCLHTHNIHMDIYLFYLHLIKKIPFTKKKYEDQHNHFREGEPRQERRR